MKVSDFEAFVQKAEELFTNDPLSCRFTIKDALDDERLILKLTDNKKCVIYALNKKSELWKLDGWNLRIMEWMSTGTEPKKMDTRYEDVPKTKTHKGRKSRK